MEFVLQKILKDIRSRYHILSIDCNEPLQKLYKFHYIIQKVQQLKLPSLEKEYYVNQILENKELYNFVLMYGLFYYYSYHQDIELDILEMRKAKHMISNAFLRLYPENRYEISLFINHFLDSLTE